MTEDELTKLEATVRAVWSEGGSYGVARSPGRRNTRSLHSPAGRYLAQVAYYAVPEMGDLCELANAVPALCTALRRAQEDLRTAMADYDDAPAGR